VAVTLPGLPSPRVTCCSDAVLIGYQVGMDANNALLAACEPDLVSKRRVSRGPGRAH
jgi:hypothetical protein